MNLPLVLGSFVYYISFSCVLLIHVNKFVCLHRMGELSTRRNVWSCRLGSFGCAAPRVWTCGAVGRGRPAARAGWCAVPWLG